MITGKMGIGSGRRITAIGILAAICLISVTGCRPEHPRRRQMLQDLARWEDRRLAPADSLGLMLRDPDAHVRLAAARTAGLIGRRSAVSDLLEVLEDPSVTVRSRAIFSLGLLGGDQAVAALSRAAVDPRPAVRMAALRGLAQAAGGGGALLQATSAPHPKEAAAAWDGLHNRTDEVDHAALVAAMDSSLAGAAPDVRWRILRCAEVVPDSSLVGALARYATDGHVQVRVHALRALARQERPDALAAVLAAADDRDRLRGRDRQRVDIALCRALGRLGHFAVAPAGNGEVGPGAELLTDLLTGFSAGDDPHVAATALAAMASCAAELPLPPEAAARESLLPAWRIRMHRAAREALESGHRGVLREAVGAWSTLRGAGCAADLARLVDTAREPSIQAAALTAAGRVHPDPLPLLMRYADAGGAFPAPGSAARTAASPLVRSAALTTLADALRERPDALPAGLAKAQARSAVAGALRAASGAKDFVVAGTAAALLAQFPDSASVVALGSAWKRPAGPERNEVGRGVIQGLAGMDSTSLDSLPAAARERAAAILQSGFDADDLRIRLESREAALSTGLLPRRLIPDEASLRLTLPAVSRDPRQPPVTLPFAAPRVVCTTERGRFTIALDGELAPNTCAAFLDLIDRGFYDELTFHRVVPDFVVQGGDPRGDGWGGPGYTIRSEWSPTPSVRGTVGIAHDGKDTGGSQFFVTLSEQPHLVGRYTVFGKVVDGMDVVDRMEEGDRFTLEAAP